MVAPNAIDVERYNFSPRDKLFLDTNIWMSVYGLQKSQGKFVKIYSDALERIQIAKSRIYIDILVVSEFINATARREWKARGEYENFKDFRRSDDFQVLAGRISGMVKNILERCSRVESGFTKLKVPALLDAYAQGKVDFNDQVIANLCRKKSLKLITHDRDFGNYGISILTANTRLLP